MNQQLFETGYRAYQSGDWAGASFAFSQCKDAHEVSGRVDHLLGNALMKQGRYGEAADAYGAALADSSYGMVGALCTNRGRALVAAGRLDEAIESLNAATQDASYATPYKAYMALGGACRATGDVRGAGIAYRNAAIDESNPDPSLSLRKLGSCFMELGRPSDAVESYRTALDFSSSLQGQNAIYCDLALAYVAANRMPEAVDAFDHATADGSFVLSPEANAAYDAARNAVSARNSEHRPSDTDDLLAATGYDSYPIDPLDPTGETSGNLMPSPEDTGFFSLSEEELVKSERGRKRGRGGKVFAFFIILLLVVAAVGGFAYYSGFGWPTQESVVEGMFAAKANGKDVKDFVAPSVDETSANQIVALVPTGATVTITGINRSMSTSEVLATAALDEGGEQSYSVTLARDGIGWKVSSFEPYYISTGETLSIEETTPEETAPQGEATAPAEQVPADAGQVPAEAAPAPAEAAPAEAVPAEPAPAEVPAA